MKRHAMISDRDDRQSMRNIVSVRALVYDNTLIEEGSA
jgi:hypothetical protein